MKEIIGNILDVKEDIIVQQVNCKGEMKAAISKVEDGMTTDGSLLFEYPYDNTVFATIDNNVVANICRQIDGWWYFYGEDDVLLAAKDLREIADVVDKLNAVGGESCLH